MPLAADNQANVWVRVVTTTAPTSTGGSFIDEIEVTGTGNPLLIGMVSFNGQPLAKGVQLTWNMSSQDNIQSFSVQRSVNGSDFTTIEDVATNSSRNYSFTDLDLPITAGKLYYRLEANFSNGNYYSNILSVNLRNSVNHYSLYPNPVSGNDVSIMLSQTLNKGATVSVVDIGGRTLLTQPVSDADILQGHVDMKLGQLSPGNYILRILDQITRKAESLPFVKK